MGVKQILTAVAAKDALESFLPVLILIVAQGHKVGFELDTCTQGILCQHLADTKSHESSRKGFSRTATSAVCQRQNLGFWFLLDRTCNFI